LELVPIMYTRRDIDTSGFGGCHLEISVSCRFAECQIAECQFAEFCHFAIACGYAAYECRWLIILNG